MNVSFFSLFLVFRQEDREFVRMLAQIRMGECPPAIVKKFTKCYRPLHMLGGVEPTCLYPTYVDSMVSMV